MSLHQCKIYDGTGKLKKTIASENISKDYWEAFTLESAEYVNFDYNDAEEPEHLRGVKKKRLYTIECSFCKKTVRAIGVMLNSVLLRVKARLLTQLKKLD